MSPVKSPTQGSIPPNQAGVIVSWLAKLALILLILGLAVYEMGTVIYANYYAGEVASDAAGQANFEYRDKHSSQEARRAAEAVVAEKNVTMVAFDIDTSKREISVTVEKKADTLFIHNIGPLRKYTTATATESKPFPS